MKTMQLAVVAGLAGALMLVAAPAAAGPPPVGSAAPDFTLPKLDGKQLTLSSWRGHAVVVNFFATWCPPCRAETADLVAAERRFARAGAIFIGVDDRESRDLVAVFARTKGIRYPQVLDSDGKVEERYDVRAIPTTYILDRNGIIRYRQVDQLDARVLAGSMSAVLAGGMPPESLAAKRFRGIAGGAEKTVAAEAAAARTDVARAHIDAALTALNRAIAAGTAANDQLDTLQSGQDSSSINYYESTQQRDRLSQALSDAYQLRAGLQSSVAKARKDAAQAALLAGQIAEDREQFAAAEKAYALATTLAPDEAKAYDGEYLAAYELKDYARALNVARAEAAIKPNDPESWLALASSENQLKDYAGALAAERKALGLALVDRAKHPSKHASYEVGRVWLKTGRTQIMAGDIAAAKVCLRTASQYAPNTIVQQQADEQYAALIPTDVRIAGKVKTAAPPSQPGHLYISVSNITASQRQVNLSAAGLPSRWVLSFCYAKVCDPYKSTITLGPNGNKLIELKMVPLESTRGPWRMQLRDPSPGTVTLDLDAKTAKRSIRVTAS